MHTQQMPVDLHTTQQLYTASMQHPLVHSLILIFMASLTICHVEYHVYAIYKW